MTAGDIKNHNSMTISWGSMGTIWNKPIVTIYIKPIRYTHTYIDNNDIFVVSFFPNEYKKALSIMGSRSGRDVSKDELSGLTPIEHNGATIYQEAKLTLICKKIYENELDINNIPKEHINTYYTKEVPHTMYIGEVIEILENKK